MYRSKRGLQLITNKTLKNRNNCYYNEPNKSKKSEESTTSSTNKWKWGLSRNKDKISHPRNLIQRKLLSTTPICWKKLIYLKWSGIKTKSKSWSTRLKTSFPQWYLSHHWCNTILQLKLGLIRLGLLLFHIEHTKLNKLSLAAKRWKNYQLTQS